MKRKQKTDRSNQLRIIGGVHRSRIIRFPEQQGLRPTSDRIRETVFNWLQDRIVNSRCLDLFAGSGALGIEALSRGAALVEFVESSATVARAIQSNLDELKLERGTVSHSSAEQWLADISNVEAFDHIFIDPPYDDKKLMKICNMLAGSSCVTVGTSIYLENNTDIDSEQLPENWRIIRSKKAGQVCYYLIEIE